MSCKAAPSTCEAGATPALGSVREVLSVLKVAAVFGYLPPVEKALAERFDVVIGTLVKLVR